MGNRPIPPPRDRPSVRPAVVGALPPPREGVPGPSSRSRLGPRQPLSHPDAEELTTMNVNKRTALAAAVTSGFLTVAGTTTAVTATADTSGASSGTSGNTSGGTSGTSGQTSSGASGQTSSGASGDTSGGTSGNTSG